MRSDTQIVRATQPTVFLALEGHEAFRNVLLVNLKGHLTELIVPPFRVFVHK